MLYGAAKSQRNGGVCVLIEEDNVLEAECDEVDDETLSVSADNKKMSPLRAIKLRCIDCCGGSYSEVKECPSVSCSLYPFRLGKNPFREKRVMTDEQRQAAAERLAKAREKVNKRS